MELLNTHSVPLDCDFVKFVETWFVQHVMNTDIAYRGNMIHEVLTSGTRRFLLSTRGLTMSTR